MCFTTLSITSDNQQSLHPCNKRGDQKIAIIIMIFADQDFTTTPHIGKLVSTCLLAEKDQTNWSLTNNGLSQTLGNSLVASQVDFCKLLLASFSAWTDCSQPQPVSPPEDRNMSTSHANFGNFYWLPQRVDFKLCLSACHSLHGFAISSLNSLNSYLCTPVASLPSRCTHRSAATGNRVIRWRITAFGTPALAFIGPTSLNKLPPSLKTTNNGFL